MSYEKGKITVLQLSALLTQVDSSKRKLILTRLSSAPIPFTVLSVTGNQCNKNFLAVCGLKDGHMLTFNSSGTLSDHLVLHPQLETGNSIINEVRSTTSWCPPARSATARSITPTRTTPSACCWWTLLGTFTMCWWRKTVWPSTVRFMLGRFIHKLWNSY